MDAFDLLRRTFIEHHAYWADKHGLLVDQLEGSEAVVKQQYAGRVPFELLQNALDRCERRVWMVETRDRLLVANDGQPISVLPSLDHEHPPEDKTELSDFHALCSLHTSNKSPDENTGNKGVGFRSVFSLTRAAWVWSRLPGQSWWWGMVLCYPVNPTAWNKVLAHPAAQAGCDRFLGGRAYPATDSNDRASHNFPIPLFAEHTPEHFPAEMAEAVTVVDVPLELKRAGERVAQALKTLRHAHLDFIASRLEHPVEVSLQPSKGERQHWFADLSRSEATLATWTGKGKKLLKKASDAGLDISKRVECAVRWPPPPVPGAKPERHDPLLYCYLPSEVRGVFSADLHADFQLGMDRKTVDTKEAEDAGSYNWELLLLIAQIHGCTVLRHLGLNPYAEGEWVGMRPADVRYPAGKPAMRDDIWCFVDPGPNFEAMKPEDDPVRWNMVCHLHDMIFAEGGELRWPATWHRWARLAAACFDGTPRATRTYREFWRATRHWINTKWPESHHAEPKKAGLACLKALREAGAQVVPITQHSGTHEHELAEERGIEPPDPEPPGIESGGSRREETLFQVVSDEEGELTELEVPLAVRRLGREVTSWKFHAYFEGHSRNRCLAGANPFKRATLLAQLRQLARTNPAEALATQPRLADIAEDAWREQVELLAFTARIWLMPVRSPKNDLTYASDTHPPGWRALQSQRSDLAPAGEALATLFMLGTDGQWRPARQCHRDQIEPSFLADLVATVPDLGEGDALDRFLGFMGVCTWAGGLLLVEGGVEGLVPPQVLPPALRPLSSRRVPQLEAVLGVVGALGEQPCDPTPAPIEPWTTRERVLEAWPAWLRPHIAQAEGTKRSAVRESLAALAWYPRGEGCARPPAGVPTPPEAVAPRELLLVARGDPRMTQCTWRVSAPGHEEDCLRHLGARSLGGVLEDPVRSRTLIRALAERYPDPAEALREHPQVTLGLTELFNAAAESLAKQDQAQEGTWPTDLPLLTQLPDRAGNHGLSVRALAWRSPERLWVAPDNGSKADLMRLFPQVPLLTATLGPQQVKGTPLVGRLLVLESEIRTDQPQPVHDAGALRAEIDAALSRLLALAHVSRAYAGVVDGAEVRARWTSTTLLRARDVWRAWWIPGHPEWGTPEPRKGRFNDVMSKPERKAKKVVSSTIHFDVERGRPRPPLAYFAEALAEALMDGSVEADWRAALSELDAEPEAPFPGPRLEGFLARMGVEHALVQYYERQLRPLTPAQRQAHRDKVNAALSGLGLELADPTWSLMNGTLLRPSDLKGGAAEIEERSIQHALADIDWVEHERPFAVDFTCQAEHMEQWRTWLSARQRHVRLLRLAWDERSADERPRDAELLTGPLAEELQTLATSAARRIRFDREQVAAEWLGREPPVDPWLPPLRSFRPVAALRAATIVPVPLNVERATTIEFGGHDPERQKHLDTRRAAKGLGAEEVFLDWVIREQVGPLMDSHGPAAWDALRSALHPGKRMWQIFEQAQRQADPDMHALLHISKRWNSAGFDVLGLEVGSDGVPQPVRYEVKALAQGTGAVRVFLSLNELNVLRGVRRTDREERFARGDWKLVGVSEDGDAVDLTGSVEPLLGGSAEELRVLAGRGVVPDGFQVVVRVG